MIKNLNRRNVLRKIGSMSAVGAFGTVGARNVRANAKKEFVGVAYDPVSGNKISDIVATISRSPNHIRGNMKFESDLGINGHPSETALPIKGESPLSESTLPEQSAQPMAVSNFVQYNSGQFESNGKPLKTILTSVESGDISGTIQRSGSLGDTVAFRLGAEDEENAIGIQANTDTKSRVEDVALFSGEVDE